MNYPYYYQPAYSVRATWALVIGLASFLICWIPFIGVLAVPGGIAGLWLGNAGFRESQCGLRGHGYAVAAMILSCVALLVALTFNVIVVVALVVA